ncbi:SRA-YDG [Arabidopsis thaliana x Arabidopsis arenosa]|uniref:SRA-YDG n=1 Tax=Arabidopsis thaliana x Arabidopsis arenosa TaxID=1240361 RepID=A0A8T2BNM7_9BRAS|nr:SRA-YDG [Arabidopsis thaliana x Arabidopsis arenosa]
MGSVKTSNSPEYRREANQELLPVMKNTHVLSPREKVLKTLRIYRIVFEELARDKAARRGKSTATTRVDHDTRAILVKEGMQVNGVSMIGQVPGVEVGDEFQYKAELNLIGLHLNMAGGIDYMGRGDKMLATSIVASQDSGYSDRFESDFLIYSGEGGNVLGNRKLFDNQKMVRGNLALANCIRVKSLVRVIRGLKRPDNKGKRYVYDGLYNVQEYGVENGPAGNAIFKFKLRRLPGQPSICWKHFF